jgi:hypothetical protein
MLVISNTRPCFLVVEGVNLRPGVNKLDDATAETLLASPEYQRQVRAGNFKEIRHEAAVSEVRLEGSQETTGRVDYDLVNLVLSSRVDEAEELISGLVAQTDRDTLTEIARAESLHKSRKSILEAVQCQVQALDNAQKKEE